MPVGSLSQARRARSRFAPCTPADHWDLVGDGAKDVEYQVINDEDCPGANHNKAERQLEAVISIQSYEVELSLLTKIRVSHVSTVEKLAGRIDSRPML